MSLIDTSSDPSSTRQTTDPSKDDWNSMLANRFVLIIDDDPQLLDLMSEALRDAGAVVSGASDGLAGLRAFAAEPPDVVVTDILMPTKEGIETIIEMKRMHPEVKILAISGGSRLGPGCFLDLARQLGADATMSKPFPFSRLIEQCAALVT